MLTDDTIGFYNKLYLQMAMISPTSTLWVMNRRQLILKDQTSTSLPCLITSAGSTLE